MKINRTPDYAKHAVFALYIIVGLLIGITLGITIAPRHDYSPCIEVAEQDKFIVSKDGVITDLAIQTMSGINYSYNTSLSKCLELSK
jgi:hypothetical protein